MIDFQNSKYAVNTEPTSSPVPKSGKMHKVMVYGTLRKGCGNDRLLVGSELVGTFTVPGYKMYSAGGFPYCVKVDDMDQTIVTEVYLVNDSTLESLDGLEGVAYNHYMRVPVDRTGFDDVELYVPHVTTSIDDLPVVKNGDWKDFDSRYGWGYGDNLDGGDEDYYFNRGHYM